jgi:predicted nucleic acid-binding protein
VTLVDTSAWVELFRATGSEVHLELRRRIELSDELATTEPVAMELLAGAVTAADVRRVRASLAACRMHAVSGADDWEHAAAIFRTCRSRGDVLRGQIDCLIAAVAIRDGMEVLTTDRDFITIARHTSLELA